MSERTDRKMRARLWPAPPPLQSTDISVQVERPINPRPLHRWEQKAQDQMLAQTEAMAVLEQMAASMGGILDFMRAAPEGDVLFAGSRIMPPAGYDTLAFPVAFSAVNIGNTSAASLVLHASGPMTSGAAPAQGAGVFTVRTGIQRTVPVRGNALTIYGAAAAAYDLAVYVRPRDASSGAI